MDTLQEKDRKKKAFYKEFSLDIIDKVKDNSVLDRLHGKGVLSDEQRNETIKDLSTAENRRKLCIILQAADYKHVATFVGIIENTSGTAQSDLVHEMKKYLSNTDPVFAQTHGLLIENEAPTASDSSQAPGPATAKSNADYSFTVTELMVTPITEIISNDVQAIFDWSKVYPKIARQATDQVKIHKLLKDEDKLHEAIMYTMQLWAAQRRGSFQDLLDLLEEHLLTGLTEKLKAKALSIKNTRKK